MEIRDERYAFFNWNTRFNRSTQSAMITTVGRISSLGVDTTTEHMVVNTMGVVYINTPDMPYLANHLRQCADAIDDFVKDLTPEGQLEIVKRIMGDEPVPDEYNVPKLKKSIKKKNYWAKFDYCHYCEATAGNPCFDLRYPESQGKFHINKAHKNRDLMEDED